MKVLLDTVVVSLSSDMYYPSDVDVMTLGERWLAETDIGQWTQDQGMKVEIRLKDNDDANGSMSARFVSKMTESQHVEFLLRWGAQG